MRTYQTIRDLDINGKRLLVRVDFNVPLDDECKVASDRRIQATLPTIRYGLKHNASMVLMSHLGRPAGEHDPKLTLRPVAERLEQLLGHSVRLVDDNSNWSPSDQRLDEIVLLQNLRFHPGEKAGDEEFARQLCEFGEIYVNDAFAACHRRHASMFAVPRQFPEGCRVIGLLVDRELETLDELLEAPKQPVTAVIGGAKVAGKMDVIESLLDRVDTLLIGGAMAYTFLKARGNHVGASIVEDEKLDIARELIEQFGERLILPFDHVIADAPNASASIEMANGGIPVDWYGMDIGPQTRGLFTNEIDSAATVLWNGPLGKFEDEPFRYGTEAIVRALANTRAKTIVGGGESGQAVEQFGMAGRINHVSTGGGAFLEYLKNGSLPALEAIDEYATSETESK